MEADKAYLEAIQHGTGLGHSLRLSGLISKRLKRTDNMDINS